MTEPLKNRDAVLALHNRQAGEIVKTIVTPTMAAGGDTVDVMVLLESICAGVIMFAAVPGVDEKIADQLNIGIKSRLIEIRKKQRKEMQ